MTGSRRGDVAVRGGSLPAWCAGEGPVVVFVHGWTLDARVWAPQVAALASQFTTVSYDRRGFGSSTAPAGLADEPDDLLRVIDWLGCERASIVAMSQGTRIALALAALYPDRVDRLVLQGAPFPHATPRNVPDEFVPISAMRDHARASRFAEMRQLLSRHALFDMVGDAPRAALAAIVGDYRGGDLIETSEGLETSPEVLHSIVAPTLIVTGSRDSALRHAAAAYLAATMPDARAVVAENGSHLCNLDTADTYGNLLVDFLAAR